MNLRSPEPSPDVSSLYIHIPFCARKCLYCNFYSVPYDEPAVRAYTAALCRELRIKGNRYHTLPLKTVYLGGGTPTLLPESCFREIFSCLREHFRLSPDAEISVEANPGTISRSKADLLGSLGVTRVSVGIQSLNDQELRILGRIHTADDAIRSLKAIIASGLTNVSIDLMYGIPGQSADSWRETVSRAAELSPTHISTYELTPEEGTPLYAAIQVSDEDRVVDMYNFAVDYLAVFDYERYEISNFALQGFRCLHNLNYWNRGGYLGAGAGAHSFINGIRSSNMKDTDAYIERLNGNRMPERESKEISAEDALREFFFLGLRMTDGISIGRARILGLDVVVGGREMLKSGHLEIVDDTALRLTRTGVVTSNAVIVRLFETLGL